MCHFKGTAISVYGKELFFICDCKKCQNCSFPVCCHTRDISHALWDGEKTFVLENNALMEDKTLAKVFDYRQSGETARD